MVDVLCFIDQISYLRTQTANAQSDPGREWQV
jgi:hypothetical protein